MGRGIGNREVKEFTCTTQGHELRVGCWRVGMGRVEGGWGENWENGNNIINKNTFKKEV